MHGHVVGKRAVLKSTNLKAELSPLLRIEDPVEGVWLVHSPYVHRLCT